MAERRYKFDLKSADLKEAPQAWVLGRSSYRIRRSHKGHPETSSRPSERRSRRAYHRGVLASQANWLWPSCVIEPAKEG